jgi:cell wall-associated NlpC family hydrolase
MIGIPYVLGGRTKEGADCYGYVWMLLKERGYILPKYDIDYTMSDRANLIRSNAPLILGQELDAPEELCIVLMYRGKYPVHIGLYINGKVYHTTKSTGSICEKVSGLNKKNRKVEFWRVKDSYTTESS